AAADADEVPGREEASQSARVVTQLRDFVAVDDVELGVEGSCHADTLAVARSSRGRMHRIRGERDAARAGEGGTTRRREAFLPPRGHGSSRATKSQRE